MTAGDLALFLRELQDRIPSPDLVRHQMSLLPDQRLAIDVYFHKKGSALAHGQRFILTDNDPIDDALLDRIIRDIERIQNGKPPLTPLEPDK